MLASRALCSLWSAQSAAASSLLQLCTEANLSALLLQHGQVPQGVVTPSFTPHSLWGTTSATAAHPRLHATATTTLSEESSQDPPTPTAGPSDKISSASTGSPEGITTTSSGSSEQVLVTSTEPFEEMSTASDNGSEGSGSSSEEQVPFDLPEGLRPRLVARTKLQPMPLMEALRLVQEGAMAREAASTARAAALGRKRPDVHDTVEAHIRLKVDPRKGDQMVRGAVLLPFGRGRTVRVAVFATGEDADAARAAGADVVGGEELVTSILESKGGNVDFQTAIATPGMMKALARIGKILGPRKLMPNPKVGTVTTDVARAVAAARQGRVEYKVDRGAIVHLPLGKAHWPLQQLYVNTGAVAASLLAAKPAVVKDPGLSGYVRKVDLASTHMKSSIPVLPSSLVAAMEASRDT